MDPHGKIKSRMCAVILVCRLTSLCCSVTVIHMDLYGCIWTHMDPMDAMDPYGSIWTHMDLYGLIWVHMDSYGSIWTHMDPFGPIWIHMDPCVSTWTTKCVRKNGVAVQNQKLYNKPLTCLAPIPSGFVWVLHRAYSGSACGQSTFGCSYAL